MTNLALQTPGEQADQADRLANLRLLTHVMYAMHTLSFFSGGLLAFIAVVINVVKRDRLPDAFYRSHFRWQSRTFWFTLIWLLLTLPLWIFFVFPGYAAWSIVGLWYLYRCVRGWWTFFEGRAMAMPDGS